MGTGDRHRLALDRRPDEPAALQPLGIERHDKAVVPKDLDQLAALATEYVKVAAMRIAFEGFLHQQGQRVHAPAHVGMAGRYPHPHARWNGDHRRRPPANAATASVSGVYSP